MTLFAGTLRFQLLPFLIAFHCSTVPSNLISVTLLHLWKDPLPIFVTEQGRIMLIKLRHPENALSPILAIELGRIMLAKLRHPENALSPILVTELPIDMFVKLLQ